MSTDTAQSRSFPCQYCERKFKRLEHAQRHERTHTKSTPYKCACGKGFPRGDLLRRHEKSAHNIDNGRRRRSHGLSIGSQQFDVERRSSRHASLPKVVSPLYTNDRSERDATAWNETQVLQGDTSASPAIGRSPELLNNAAQRNASMDQQPLDPMSKAQTIWNENGPSFFPPEQGLFDFGSTSLDNGLDPFDLFGEGDTILENVDFSSLFLPYDFGLDQGTQGNSSGPNQINGGGQSAASIQHTSTLAPNSRPAESNPISRLGSPLPSVVPEDERLIASRNGTTDKVSKSTPCWKVSKQEYHIIQQKISDISKHLPHGFSLPSRHSMSRYLEGCLRGLLEHMPILHIPTWSSVSAAPDLLLSMVAIGAQFRFEGNVAFSLFYAAKLAVTHQLHKYKNDNETSVNNRPRANGEDYNGVERHGRLQTMQAILCLMVSGSWGPRQLVTEAIGLQSMLAELVREDGLGPDSAREPEIRSQEDANAAWLEYIEAESLRRTKLTAYTFTTLQSVAYNVPPCILTSEVQLSSPASQKEWNAKTSDDWVHERRASKLSSMTFTEAFRSLFPSTKSSTSSAYEPSSALENYALMFAILQRIFLLREGGSIFSAESSNGTLDAQNVETLSRALQNWQARWEASPESNIEPQSSSGPVAFNSTALLRLAWIRLHSDLGPCRNLVCRNPSSIVEAFERCPPLIRHSGLMPALLHAAHALSIPVRLGISYVAKTQTLSWSVQHSLCNLECAIFLSKWFEAVASTVAINPLTNQEIGLISMIRGIVLETGFFREDAFEPANDEKGWQKLIRHLGTAVAALWGQVFSGTHVFDLVSTIGTSLNMYAKILEHAHSPINGQIL